MSDHHVTLTIIGQKVTEVRQPEPKPVPEPKPAPAPAPAPSHFSGGAGHFV